MLPAVTAKTTCLAALNLLIINQKKWGWESCFFFFFHKGLEVIVLEGILKAVNSF